MNKKEDHIDGLVRISDDPELTATGICGGYDSPALVEVRYIQQQIADGDLDPKCITPPPGPSQRH